MDFPKFYNYEHGVPHHWNDYPASIARSLMMVKEQMLSELKHALAHVTMNLEDYNKTALFVIDCIAFDFVKPLQFDNCHYCNPVEDDLECLEEQVTPDSIIIK